MSQLRAASTSRKTNTRMWGEKKLFGGGGGAAAASGGVSGVTPDPVDRMRAIVNVPTTPGFVSVAVPAGGNTVIPYDLVSIPSLLGHIALASNAVSVAQDAIYYVGVSVLLYVPAFTGQTLVEIDIFKDNVSYQNIIFDYTSNGFEIEQRYHAADYVRLNNTSSMDIRIVNRGATPLTFNLRDAYLDVGFGPLR